jgi:hypothetical protein
MNDDETNMFKNDESVSESSAIPKKTRRWPKKIVITLWVIGLFGLLLLGVYLSEEFFIPQYHYSRAEKLLANGDRRGAISEFNKVSGYSNAGHRSAALIKAEGRELLKVGKYEEVLSLFYGFKSWHVTSETLAIQAVASAKVADNMIGVGNYDGALQSLWTASRSFRRLFDGKRQDDEGLSDVGQSIGSDIGAEFLNFMDSILTLSDNGLTDKGYDLLFGFIKDLSRDEFYDFSFGNPKHIARYAYGNLETRRGNTREAIRSFVAANGYRDSNERASKLLASYGIEHIGGLEWFVEGVGNSVITLVSKKPFARIALHDGSEMPDSTEGLSLVRYISDHVRSQFSGSERARITSVTLPQAPLELLKGEEYWLASEFRIERTTTYIGNTSTVIKRTWKLPYVSVDGLVVRKDFTYTLPAQGGVADDVQSEVIGACRTLANSVKAVYLVIDVSMN